MNELELYIYQHQQTLQVQILSERGVAEKYEYKFLCKSSKFTTLHVTYGYYVCNKKYGLSSYTSKFMTVVLGKNKVDYNFISHILFGEKNVELNMNMLIHSGGYVDIDYIILCIY